MKQIGNFLVPEENDLSRKELQEGEVYSATLAENGRVMINDCLFTVLNGQLMIHRSANWENVPRSDLSEKAFMEDLDFRWNSLPCFRRMGQQVIRTTSVALKA